MRFDIDKFKRELESGFIDPAVMLDEEVYRLELERVWRRSWVFVAHETMLPKPGDYITTFIAEDPIIVTRDAKGNVRVFLNRCRHKGVKLCPFDRGSAKTFSCIYHGWVFANDGALIDVPQHGTGYGEILDKSEWGLIEVPRVASYGGFIFANWDAGAVSLDDYLGDMRYYFDHLFGRLEAGGIDMSPIKQRAVTHHNWKIAAENASDMYHVAGTHAGAVDCAEGVLNHLNFLGMSDSNYTAVIHESEAGKPSHSVLSAQLINAEAYDLEMAERFGQEAVDYVRRRYSLMDRNDARIGRGAFSVGGVFPSLTLVDHGPVSIGVSIELYHPKGPRETETWVYVYVEKDMPDAFKKFASTQSVRLHSMTGSVMPPDHENWERLDQGIGSPMSRTIPLNYMLGMGGTGGSEPFKMAGFGDLPGRGEYCMSERGSRSFYLHWAQMMQEA